MKVYNSKDWIAVILKPHQSEVFSQMNKLILFVCLLTFLVVYIEQDWLRLPNSHPLKNTVALQSLLGFAISILLVFRTNTAYDRWWEGRKAWGLLVNSSRNFAIKIDVLLSNHSNEKAFFKKMIPLYAKAMLAHLKDEKTRLMLDEIDHPELNIDKSNHIPNQIAKVLFEKVIKLQSIGILTPEQLLLINSEITNLTDICGSCERIKNTPIPYSYSAFIKKVVFFYVLTLPFGLSFTLGYFSVPVVALVFYVMIGLEFVAEEIEDPFGSDKNDIPMDKICENIDKHVKEIFE